jgi:predicted  nucleic acid-binding Zn-ribbon protein
MVDEKLRIRCTKCSQVFRERAQNVRPGFQTNCHHCNRLITFDPTVEDRNVRKALANARELRAVIEASRRAATAAREEAPAAPVMERGYY